MTISVYAWNWTRPKKVDKFTGPMPFYKIMREDMTHRGLHYHVGLNIDKVRFNPRSSCKPGGMYFACQDILSFLDYGSYICKVTLPDGAKVYCEGNKYKADRFILGKKMRITSKVLIRLFEEGAHLPTSYYQNIIRHIAINERNCDLLGYTGVDNFSWSRIFSADDPIFVKEVLSRYGAEHKNFIQYKSKYYCSEKMRRIVDKWLKAMV